MAIFQGLLALITRSLGSILSALFGWAVVALFGPTSSREKVWLSALVGAAAAWPILVLGAIWPGWPRCSSRSLPCRRGFQARSSARSGCLGGHRSFCAGNRGGGTIAWTGCAHPGHATDGVLGGLTGQRRAPRPVHESKIVQLFRGFPITRPSRRHS